MTQTCPDCLQADLADAARKCYHCGSWLTEEAAPEVTETLRQATRAELRADLKEHRDLIDRMLARLQTVGGLIVAASLAAAVFFGWRTDSDIAETARNISAQAETEIAAAARNIQKVASDRVAEVVEAEMNAPETAMRIEAEIALSLKSRVEEEVAAKFDVVSAAVDQQIDAVSADLDALRDKAAVAVADFDGFQRQLDGAKAQNIGALTPQLPLDLITISGKGGADLLPDLVAQRINAISFRLGDFYYGPTAWLYLARLRSVPEFKYVVLLEPDSNAVRAIYDADVLSIALDPAESILLLGDAADNLVEPDESAVAGWTLFAQWVTDQNAAQLAALPSYQDAREPVETTQSSVTALAQMDRLGVDILPVVDGAGSFVGVVERSRLTTQMLLGIAGSPLR